MTTIGVDPGNEQTAIVATLDDGTITFHWKGENKEVAGQLALVACAGPTKCQIGIECVASYGMAVGREVFETAEWCGRIRESAGLLIPALRIFRIYRRDVKLHLCNSAKAKDANIRQAILDRYPRNGVGAVPQVGTSKSPGPLFGISKDKWAALGVALTTAETTPIQFT